MDGNSNVLPGKPASAKCALSTSFDLLKRMNYRKSVSGCKRAAKEERGDGKTARMMISLACF